MRPSCALFLAAYALYTSASLYPTTPVSATTWIAGTSHWTTWIDDKTSPRLSNIGQVTINMYSENDTFVQTLARNVSPTKRKHKVHIPKYTYSEDSKFFLRFTSRRPRLTVYTAMFDVLPFPDTAKAEALAPADLMTLSAPPTTSNATATPTSSSDASPAETTIYAAPLPKGERPGNTNTNGDYASRRIDVEKLKFRVVFVLWPALIGISMSL
ncbi:hypothetical protein PLEOSDRAFT_1114433 [Pleurotus ostreatus PC15]|uniref:Uncharacterized protein n=1 Tax=Pleurotus ostreatus (strain PC15) TaxID=1137138 RepID=A0A067N6G7_PLEO1|nr:hypothetical protein PLEOSDRAFT_1114433 [Pleurotus ostreatus PC15]